MSEPRPQRDRQIVAPGKSTVPSPTERRFAALGWLLLAAALVLAFLAGLDGVIDGRNVLAGACVVFAGLSFSRAHGKESTS